MNKRSRRFFLDLERFFMYVYVCVKLYMLFVNCKLSSQFVVHVDLTWTKQLKIVSRKTIPQINIYVLCRDELAKIFYKLVFLLDTKAQRKTIPLRSLLPLDFQQSHCRLKYLQRSLFYLLALRYTYYSVIVLLYPISLSNLQLDRQIYRCDRSFYLVILTFA